MRRFCAPHIPPDAGEVCLEPEESVHIRTVLRLLPGDTIRLFDGKGREWDGEIVSVDNPCVRVKNLRRVETAGDSFADITIALGFLKEKKMDTLVRQLTELGIRRLVPFLAERSVARPDKKKLAARHGRWQKIAKESLKQCRRSRAMEIAETVTFSEMLETVASGDSVVPPDSNTAVKANDLRLIFWEECSEGSRGFSSIQKAPGVSVFAILGPEGGFGRKEVEMAEQAGFQQAGLGPRILRAETAAIAAAALLQSFFGDMQKSD